MVRTGAQTEELLARLPDPLDVLMMSTVEPELAAELGRRHAGRLTIVDAPVSGGVRGAEAATLAIYAAGPPDALARVRPLLEVLGGSIFVLGSEPGLGQAAKVANQVMMGAALAGTMEGLGLARAYGLEDDAVIDAVLAGTGASWVLDHWPWMRSLWEQLRARQRARHPAQGPARHRRGGRAAGRAAAVDRARARAPARADSMTYSIGIDVGGTFTDLVLLDEQSGRLLQHKTPSTPDDPSRGVAASPELAEQLGLRPVLDQVGLIVHGTTVTTNAVLTEQRRATGPPDDRGVPRHPRDAPRRAQPQAPLRQQVRRRRRRSSRATCACRCTSAIDVRGQVRTPLDEGTVRDALDALVRREGVEAVAVCFMHAYADAGPRARGRRSSSRSSRPSSSSPSRRRSCRRSGSTSASVDDRDERVRRPGAPRATSSGSIAALAEASLRRHAARDAVERRRRDAGDRGPQPGLDRALRARPAARSPALAFTRAAAARTTASSSTWAARASTPRSSRTARCRSRATARSTATRSRCR